MLFSLHPPFIMELIHPCHVSGRHSPRGEWSTSGLVNQLRDEVMQMMEKEVTEQEERVESLLAKGQDLLSDTEQYRNKLEAVKSQYAERLRQVSSALVKKD